MINDIKKLTDSRITLLENGQVVMGNVMNSMEVTQSTMGTCMKKSGAQPGQSWHMH